MKKALIAILTVLMLLIVACGGTQSEPTTGPSTTTASEGSTAAFKGTWERQGSYANGEKVSAASATLELTANSFSSSSEVCENSGKLDVKGDTMVMTVEKSDCPSIINVGSKVTYTYSVSGPTLTIINTEYGAEVKEIYNKR